MRDQMMLKSLVVAGLSAVFLAWSGPASAAHGGHREIEEKVEGHRGHGYRNKRRDHRRYGRRQYRKKCYNHYAYSPHRYKDHGVLITPSGFSISFRIGGNKFHYQEGGHYKKNRHGHKKGHTPCNNGYRLCSVKRR